MHQMLSGLRPENQETVWAEIGEALTEFETTDGFNGPCELVVAVGTK